jgi:heavy metal efflux system protein
LKFLDLILEFSLKNRFLVWLILGIFVFFGVKSVFSLKMDAVPDVTNIQVQVITVSQALSPLEVEQYITYNVEKSMSGLPHLKELRSISRYGLSVVTVVFAEDVNIYRARQMVAERIQEARELIPYGYGSPMMGPITSALGEVYQFIIESDRHDLIELTTYLHWEIVPKLKTIPGIIEVNTFGGNTKQYQILLDFRKAQSFGINLKDVWESVNKNNENSGGGYIEREGEHFLISSNGLFKGIEDLESLQVGISTDGFPVTLSMISEIRLGHKLKIGASTVNGKGETVGAIAMMLLHENALEVCQKTDDKINELRKNLPEGMKIITFYDRSIMVKSTIKTVLLNLLEGAILVVIILFLFIGSIRAGLIIALVIPLSMLFAIFLMDIRGESGNLMSLGAIDFGLIIDGAVIIIENSSRRLFLFQKEFKRDPNPEERLLVIKDATMEVRKATIFGELIIAIVYFPILSLSGIEGKMFTPMALTVLYALLGAFIFSLSIVPVLAYQFVKIPSSVEHESKFYLVLKTYYEKLLEKVFYKSRLVFVLLFLLFILSSFLYYKIGGEFLPNLDEGSLLIEVGRLPSTSLSKSIEISGEIEKKALKKFSEITGIVSRTGSPDVATDPMGMERTDMYFKMKPRDDWDLSRNKLIGELEELMEENYPEVSFSISQPIQMRTNELLAGIKSDVGIKIFGDDLDDLKNYLTVISQILINIEGVKDVRIEQLNGLNYFRILPKRERLARYNVSMDEIHSIVKTFAVGLQMGYILEGRKKFEIVLLNSENLKTPEEMMQVSITLKNGHSIPLGDLIDINEETGPAIISHQNYYRRALIEFNVRGRDMLSVVSELDKTINTKLKLKNGFFIEYDGNYKNYISARNTLMIVIPITLVLIYLILWFVFKETPTTILVFLNVPFSVTGGLILLTLRGMPFSISAGVGFVALFGVAILNGLVLITFAKDLEKFGYSKEKSIYDAALLRLRPVLTTASVAAIGFIPMALSTNMGSEVQRPLATVVIGGIISSSALTLIILPTLYRWYFHERKLHTHSQK